MHFLIDLPILHTLARDKDVLFEKRLFEIEGVIRDTCLQGEGASGALSVAGKKVMCIMFIPFQ